MATTEERRRRSEGIRTYTAAFYDTLVQPNHPNNGDESDFAHDHYFASFTKGLHHNALGEVIPADYHKLLHALKTEDPADFNAIPQGFTGPGKKSRNFTNPQAGLAFDLEGIDSHLLTIPPAYKFNSAGSIGEIAENYWLALCRDIPFADYNGDATVASAITDLNKYAVFDGPRDAGGQVTLQTLFRGLCPDITVTPNLCTGPYISQFLLMNLPYGAESIEQKVSFALPEGMEYMIDPADWLAVQKGKNPQVDPAYVSSPQYLYRGRDLAQYVHIDELFQAYLNACLLLITPHGRGGLQAPLNPGNPYPGTNQDGFGTFGEPNFKVIVAEIATRALKAVWFQKWFVHRRARPETYAGRIHHQLVGTPGSAKYPFEAAEFAKLQASVLPAVHAHNEGLIPGINSYLLPMSFPEGSPIHPAYGAGHAAVAGACVTVLKAIFKDTEPIEPLIAQAKRKPGSGSAFGTVVEPSNDGAALNPYTGADAGLMTVGSELDKLAGNVGIARNFAGVHWRSDYTASLILGEQVAINFLRETVLTYNENAFFTFTRFDGKPITISKAGIS